MSSPRLLPALALSGFLTAGFSVAPRAADVTPAQASALEGQLRDWMGSLVSPALDVGAHPVKLVAEGDHFNVEIPAPGILSSIGLVEPGLSIRLKARPLDGGRWALDNLALPSPLKFHMLSDIGSKTDKRVGGEVSFTGMEYQAVLDPTFTTASTFDGKMTGLHIVTPTSSALTALSTHHMTWQPAGNGIINVVSEDSSEKSTSKLTENDTEITYSIDKSHATTRFNSVSTDSLAALIRSVSQLIPSIRADATSSLTPPQRVLARTAVLALRDLFAGLDGTQTMDGIKFAVPGVASGSVSHIILGTQMGVTNGKLGLSVALSVDGFDSPSVPPGVLRDYMVRKLVLKPRVSGIPSEGVVKLLLKAIDTDAKVMDVLKRDVFTMMASNPLDVAIDEMSIDMGPAKLVGAGALHIATSENVWGEAKVTATGLEALIKRANTSPEIEQAAPVLIFLKGIGKQNGDDTVFNISFKDGTLMVNDTDLSSMIGASKGPKAGKPNPKTK